jgi:hypothetical protein
MPVEDVSLSLECQVESGRPPRPERSLRLLVGIRGRLPHMRNRRGDRRRGEARLSDGEPWTVRVNFRTIGLDTGVLVAFDGIGSVSGSR